MKYKKLRTKELDAVIGSNVRRFRVRAGMSQQALGDTLRCSFQQIQKYEKAVNRVSASTLYEIAVVLEMPIEAFFKSDAASK